eukprot:GHVL01036155.1.p3 GENE.GHVL01036155.1~~GHVL01036155.1.p3  ORF type:complete len:240 (+),score=40.56 GHVL01036155.1:66-785(+)
MKFLVFVALLRSGLTAKSCPQNTFPVMDFSKAPISECAEPEESSCAGFWADTLPKSMDDAGKSQLETFEIKDGIRGQYYFLSGCQNYPTIEDLLVSDDIAVQLMWRPNEAGMESTKTSNGCVVMLPRDNEEFNLLPDQLGVVSKWYQAVSCMCKEDDCFSGGKMYMDALIEAKGDEIDKVEEIVTTKAPDSNTTLPTVPPDFDWDTQWSIKSNTTEKASSSSSYLNALSLFLIVIGYLS